MSSAGLRFTIDCPKLPERVHVDPALWEKVILNLLVVEDDDDRLLAVAWEFCGPTSRARSQP